MASIQNHNLPGAMVRLLMRKRGITIRDLAAKFKITMKRVREVRASGVRGFAANEWHYMITGAWLDLPRGGVSPPSCDSRLSRDGQ